MRATDAGALAAGVDANPGAGERSPRLRAADDLRRYIDAVDWSGMTYRRRQILEAFVSLASTNGYSSVTMRSLGAQVGVKAPSIYRHFANGREEIVTEAFRWHFYRFASAVLAGVDETTTAQDYWDSLVRVHLQRQLESPENDLWDILMASDRIGGFLPSETRSEYTEWLGLYERMYAAAATEMGYQYDDVAKFVRVVVKVLDTANEWCNWDGTKRGLQHCVTQATTISRALIEVDLGPRAAARR